MANEQNLRPFDSNQSREAAKINGAKGGIASGESRRRKKTMREIAVMLGEARVTSQKTVQQLCSIYGIESEDVTHDLAVIARQYSEAEKGNVQSARYISELKGEIKNKTELTGAEGKPLIPENTLSNEDLDAEIIRLQKKGE